MPLSPTLDTAGFSTRTVADAQLVFHAISHLEAYENVCSHIAEQNERDQHIRFRIGVDDGLMWSESEPELSEICLNALRELENDNCQLVSFEFPQAKRAVDMRNLGGPVSVELIEFLNSELPEWFDALDPVIRQRIKMGGDISAIEYLRRVREIKTARKEVKEIFHAIDIIASPTVPISPPLLSEVSSPESYMKKNLLTLQNTTVGSFLNLCAITVPVGLDRFGMPVGLQFMTRAGSELFLLALGLRIEKIVRNQKRMPF